MFVIVSIIKVLILYSVYTQYCILMPVVQVILEYNTLATVIGKLDQMDTIYKSLNVTFFYHLSVLIIFTVDR